MPRANEVYPIRPERAEAPSPGHRHGYYGYIKVALKGQKLSISKLLPFQGDLVYLFFSIFFTSFSNLLRYISPAMVKPNGKAIQMPSNPMPQGKPRV